MVDDVPCAACMGAAASRRRRGRPVPRLTLDQISQWPLAAGRTLTFFKGLKLTTDEQHIAGDLVREVRDRLKFLVDVGLDYLTLARGTPTLSGGESQRIRLASQIGSGLTGVLYVLDEPTIGLHPRDNARLLAALRHLRDLGNTLVLVEHDREVIEAADHLVDFGPGSGDGGGEITAAGRRRRSSESSKSLTGQYLGGTRPDPGAEPTAAAAATAAPAIVDRRGAAAQPARTSTCRFPLGVVTAVTGVSGSGKSSLVEDILWKAAAKRLHRRSDTPGAHDAIEGLEQIDKVISVDQTPLGSTPTSTPARTSGAFDLIRELFAKLPEAKVRGYTPRRFSFNQPGGRCEACEGRARSGSRCTSCPTSGSPATPAAAAATTRDPGRQVPRQDDRRRAGHVGRRGARAVRQRAQDPPVLADACTTSAWAISARPGRADALRRRGPARQARRRAGPARHRQDALHPRRADDRPALRRRPQAAGRVHRLADLGNTVVVIEHNLEVIKTADWVIDLGPEAGRRRRAHRRRPGRPKTRRPDAEGAEDQRPPRTPTPAVPYTAEMLAPVLAARGKLSDSSLRPAEAEEKKRAGGILRLARLAATPRCRGRPTAVGGIPSIAWPATAKRAAGKGGQLAHVVDAIEARPGFRAGQLERTIGGRNHGRKQDGSLVPARPDWRTNGC